MRVCVSGFIFAPVVYVVGGRPRMAVCRVCTRATCVRFCFVPGWLLLPEELHQRRVHNLSGCFFFFFFHTLRTLFTIVVLSHNDCQKSILGSQRGPKTPNNNMMNWQKPLLLETELSEEKKPKKHTHEMKKRKRSCSCGLFL